jgi:putative phosphonate metabolism protein
MSEPRYALYALAEPGSALEAFGRSVLGYDNVTGGAVPSPADLPGLAEVTAGARVYGFHATLKAPMRLAPGVDEADLLAGARRLAADHPPVAVGDLTVAALGRFLALVPVASPPALGLLAAECVAALDPLRAPLTEAEIAKRRPERLTARGRALLDRWGYPHVFEEFRFHMTLTDALPDEAVESWRARLADAYARSGAGPLTIGSVAILRQDGSAPFRLLQRIPFGREQGFR